jgi:hypothetical protein
VLQVVVAFAGAASCERTPGESTAAPEPKERARSETPAQIEVGAVDRDRMLADVRWLADDALQGRYTLAPELEIAAKRLAARQAENGLGPVGGPSGSHLVPFPLVVGARQTAPATLTVGAKPAPASALSPVPQSPSGSAQGELVFVGYAARSEAVEELSDTGDATAPTIESKPLPVYDDLAGVDLKGKVALVLLDAPGVPDMRAFFDLLQEEVRRFDAAAKPLRAAKDLAGMTALHVAARRRIGALVEPFLRGHRLEASFFGAPEEPLEASLDLMTVMGPVMKQVEALPGPKFGGDSGSLRGKLERLSQAGAVGAIVVRGPRSFATPEAREEDALPELAKAGTSASQTAPLPVLQVRWKQADRLFRVGGRKLSELQQKIDRDLEPQSRTTGQKVQFAVHVAPLEEQVPNVVAVLPGSDLAAEIVLIGAHYDHIGNATTGRCSVVTGEDGVEDAICNGADDNASGTAMVLELARLFGATRPRRTLVFAHFAGEELGLFGSAALAARPPAGAPFTGGQVVAMVNLDMVGRLGPKGLAIGGLSSSDGWLPILDRVGNAGLPILYDKAIASRSDHANFYKKNIPVLFFFTNVHADYHRATDHFDKIDGDGMQKIGTLVAGVVGHLAAGAPIAFTAPTSPADGLASGLPGSNRASILKKVKADGSAE